MDALCFDALSAPGKTAGMKARLRQQLKPGGDFQDLSRLEVPVPNPLKPELLLLGTIADECSVFASATHPVKLTFSCCTADEYEAIRASEAKLSKAEKLLGAKTGSGKTYDLLYKLGDDLRQDQLFIQVTPASLLNVSPPAGPVSMHLS